jgi:hypothetical protein
MQKHDKKGAIVNCLRDLALPRYEFALITLVDHVHTDLFMFCSLSPLIAGKLPFLRSRRRSSSR